MTQELERQFRRALDAVVEFAAVGGIDGDVIAHDLQSLASEVGRKWNAVLDRRNAKRIETGDYANPDP